jgi:hypothetical protein
LPRGKGEGEKYGMYKKKRIASDRYPPLSIAAAIFPYLDQWAMERGRG